MTTPELASDWAHALAPVRPTIDRLLTQCYAPGSPDAPATLPPRADVLRAFSLPLARVKVVIVGQDPYPTPGNSMGLAFSVRKGVPIPRSLTNIFTELATDLGLPTPASGDLSPWHDQGVLLLNRVLTVPAGAAGGHRKMGWEEVTARALEALAERGGPLVAILWGRDAAAARVHLGATPALESAHPSPLSARRGFFGSRPFSRANELLAAQGAAPIDWALPAANTPSSGIQLELDLG